VGKPVVILLRDMDDEFCSDFADGDCFDLLDVYLALDGCFRKELLVPLRL
jgi:hypothetical protein